MEEEKKTNWNLLKEQDWEQIRKDMLESKNEFMSNKTNKEKLLFMICKSTGIEFKDIQISPNEKGLKKEYKMSLHTEMVRPEMGVCGKYIYKFGFGLHYRTPITKDDGTILLSFYPSLNFKLMSGGGNGFEVKNWFYYNVKTKEWFLK